MCSVLGSSFSCKNFGISLKEYGKLITTGPMGMCIIFISIQSENKQHTDKSKLFVVVVVKENKKKV